MIKDVEITNFQCHKHSLLEFSEGVNVIVGPSDEGKSAVIRAIRWGIQNDPSGIAFRSYFAKKDELTSVAISTDDERWVVRERDETVNRYKLWNIKDPLEAFGQGPVKEVLDTFNLSTFAIQGQHEQYFLLQSSPGEVSRVLNELTGLGVSDDLLKKIGSILYKARDGISNADEMIERLKGEIKEYFYLDALEVDLGKLEKALKERELARQERRGILDLTNQIGQVNAQIEEWDSWLEIEPEAKGLIDEVQGVEVLMRERALLQTAISKIEFVNEEIKALDEEADDHQKALALQKEMREIFHLRQDYRQLKDAIERLDNFDGEIGGLDSQIKIMKEEKDKYGIICQNCGARLEL
uniref:Putative ATPase domain containing protein n=1 Tax=viral metagenome TaxID=1070528 RepID=A0A6H2A0N6_9ZZZZ